MKRADWAVGFTGVVAGVLALAAACSSSSGASGGPTSCASNSDCSGGAVCGFPNTLDAGGCTAARGLCVTPVNEQPTNLCGCAGESIELVVDDVDAGVYYWSGVITGEKGFPPCGDAAIAPSSNADAISEAMADGEAGAPD
jgi:hypothetical protein